MIRAHGWINEEIATHKTDVDDIALDIRPCAQAGEVFQDLSIP